MTKTLSTFLLVAMAMVAMVTPAMAGKGGGVKPPPPGTTVNACGCYRDAQGACFCPKKGKCDCPGDCEPVSCEAKRQKEQDKVMAEEIKKAKEADKKQQAAMEKDDADSSAGDDAKKTGDDAKKSGKDQKPAGHQADKDKDKPVIEKKGKNK